MTLLRIRVLPILIVLAGALGGSSASQAQNYPQAAPPPPGGQPPASNPMCVRLEAQLATIDRGGADQARADQIRRYEDAANRQQAELDRVTAQAQRMGCDSSGFFSLFNGRSAQCGPVNSQIQKMRTNLDQINSTLEQLHSGGNGGYERDNQRRSVLLALAQNNCGQQYVNAARQQQQNEGGGFFGNLFGNNNDNATIPPPSGDYGPQAGTYRTVCVRSCDGFYFPISFATVPSRFPDDERACKAQCPAADATLFTYRNPGEDINQAVSINGQPYSSLPNAFAYRKTFNPSCSCKPAGETWAEALKNIDDKSSLEQGDIIVTDQQSRKMAQPKPVSTKGISQKKGATAESAPAAAAQSNASTAAPANDGHIRRVGPKFLQNQ